jgi:hypothetical protein
MATGLLAAYDNQLRGRMPGRLPDGVTVERDGPLFRFQGLTFGGFIGYRDLGGMGGSELDELIARQVRAFAERAARAETKRVWNGSLTLEPRRADASVYPCRIGQGRMRRAGASRRSREVEGA